ncbi:hypothetical protein ACLQ18_08825 [Streptomyces sp. DT193]|uniref:hypothetical protein n=1 Tax=Streptomyces sp. DT193 TaxID=3393418 RepID=UPI003CE9A8C2
MPQIRLALVTQGGDGATAVPGGEVVAEASEDSNSTYDARTIAELRERGARSPAARVVDFQLQEAGSRKQGAG